MSINWGKIGLRILGALWARSGIILFAGIMAWFTYLISGFWVVTALVFLLFYVAVSVVVWNYADSAQDDHDRAFYIDEDDRRY